MKLYVGNLSFSTTEEALQAEFEAHGQVEEVADDFRSGNWPTAGICVCFDEQRQRGAGRD